MASRVNITKNTDRNDYSMPVMTDEENMAAIGFLKDCVQTEPDPAWDEEELERNILFVTADLLIDLHNKKLYRSGVVTGMIEPEVRTGIFLAKNCHTVCTRDSLLDNYGSSYFYPEVISKHMYSIRQHLGCCTLERFKDRPYIVTMHKVGYKWNYPVLKVYRIPGKL